MKIKRYTREEAAKSLGISVSTLDRLRREGKIESTRDEQDNFSVRIPETSIENFLRRTSPIVNQLLEKNAL